MLRLDPSRIGDVDLVVPPPILQPPVSYQLVHALNDPAFNRIWADMQSLDTLSLVQCLQATLTPRAIEALKAHQDRQEWDKA